MSSHFIIEFNIRISDKAKINTKQINISLERRALSLCAKGPKYTGKYFVNSAYSSQDSGVQITFLSLDVIVNVGPKSG